MYQGMSQCVSQQVMNDILDHLFIRPLTGTNSVSLPVLFCREKRHNRERESVCARAVVCLYLRFKSCDLCNNVAHQGK